MLFLRATKYLRPFAAIPGCVYIFEAYLYALTRIHRPGVCRAMAYVETTAGSWDGIRVCAHRYGGTEFRLVATGNEVGHFHGNGVLDVKLSAKIKDQLRNKIALLPHHVLPSSTTWATFLIESEQDADTAVYLLRLAYEEGKRHLVLLAPSPKV